MSDGGFAYALALYRDDGESLKQVPASVDWEPATEWIRMQAIRRGLGGPEVFERPCEFEPVWDAVVGPPFLEGLRGTIGGPDPGAGWDHVFPIRYLGRRASEVATDLVADGRLGPGERFTYRVLAFSRNGAGSVRPPAPSLAEGSLAEGSPATAGVPGVASEPTVPGPVVPAPIEPRSRLSRRFSSRTLAPAVPVEARTLPPLLAGAETVGTLDPLDFPLVVPQRVFTETAALASEAGARETGGILIGHLRQDPSVPEAFVEVTGQIPARGADADTNRLSFTPEVWTTVRAALDLRDQDEIMVGWWHSHPVHEWCKGCPEEKRRVCPLGRDFLSAHDRLLHRTVFPRGYGTALVVNELGDEGSTFSLFGWREGRIETRGYFRQPTTKRGPHA